MKLCAKCGTEMEERYDERGGIEILCVACAAEEPKAAEAVRRTWKPWIPAKSYPEPKSTVRA